MNLSIFLLILLYMANIISGITVLFNKDKNTSNTIVWIMLFIFFPFIGYIFYFFFGSTYKIKLLTKKYNLKEIEEQNELLVQKLRAKAITKVVEDNNELDEKYKDMIMLNYNNALNYYSENNDAMLFSDATTKFEYLLEDIKNAKSSIHILYFIIKQKDDITKKLIDLLVIKAKEGVSVKLIYDRFGDFTLRYKHFKELIDAGGEVCQYLPSLINSAIQINYRMHRKVVVIDGVIGYTGGINIGDEYMGSNPKKSPWRDSAVRLTGDSVTMLQMRFLSDWYFLERQQGKAKRIKEIIKNAEYIDTMFPNPISNNNMGVQILSSGPNTQHSLIKDGYLKMINKAKKYLYIHTPYFVPDETILDSLRIASLSGVDVRIIIPGIPDKKYVYYVTLSHVELLLSWGIKVYTYNGFIHSKMFIIDDEVVSIGTANLDIRSFIFNYEINAFIYNEKFAIESKESFLKDIENSKEIIYSTFLKRSIWHKTKEALSKIIAPLM